MVDSLGRWTEEKTIARTYKEKGVIWIVLQINKGTKI